MASRVPLHYQSFICEDKLDKWIDLEKLHMFQVHAGECDSWRQYQRIKPDNLYSAESVYMFDISSISTKSVGQALVTPLIIPRIHQKLLREKTVNCHLSSTEARHMLKTIKKAASMSLSIQLDHLLGQLSTDMYNVNKDAMVEFSEKVEVWPRELKNYMYAMEDVMKILEWRRKLVEPVHKRNPFKRAEIKCYGGDCSLNPSLTLQNTFVWESIGARLTMTSANSMLHWEGQNYLLSDELLLEMCNKIAELFCALLTAHLLSGNSHPADFYTKCTRFWSLLTRMMLRFGIQGMTGLLPEVDNKPFSILKTMEGLGVACIMATEDALEGWENTDLMQGMWSGLVELKLVTQRRFQDHELGRLFASMTTPEIANLLGTVKLMGHPAIELRSGATELYKRTHAQLTVDPMVVAQTQGIMIRDLVKGFYKSHKKLPNIQPLDPAICHNLTKVFIPIFNLANADIRRHWYAATPLEWSLVKFDKNQEFDSVDNQLSIIKDKSLGSMKSQVVKMMMLNAACAGKDLTTEGYPSWYDDCIIIQDRKKLLQTEEARMKSLVSQLEDRAYEMLDEGLKPHDINAQLNETLISESIPIKGRINVEKVLSNVTQIRSRREERRTLLMYLITPDFNKQFKQYFNKYQDQDVWDSKILDHLVIKLTAKELEEKQVGRYFGASGPLERNRRIVQEHNVMILMHHYIPDQLMTPNELQIMKKLVSFRYFNRLYPNHVLFQVSFDFSKWNNNMRDSSIDVPASAVLDPWFGTKLYGKTMKAFQHMCVYLHEASLKTFWEGQDGGIEGLNQATWSLVFLAGIKNALEGAGLKYQVTVKGDDVRAVIAVTSDEVAASGGYSNTRDRIMERIHELCKSMGWQLNPQESFVSLTLISTSKQYQVRETWLPASLKKAMKMLSLSNLLLPTFEDLIGSIFSTAHSACSQNTNVIPIYTTALIVASLELYRHLPRELRVVDSISFLTMWPQVMGGPGALPLQTFFVRGENDMLSVGSALMLSIIRYQTTDRLSRYAMKVLDLELDKTPDPGLLITDPYSIPLKIPQRPSSILRKLIQLRLTKWVKNKEIRGLLSNQGISERNMYINHLFSMNPYLGKVATAVFECSPFYLLDELLAKFMESPTIVALFAGGRDIPPELRLGKTLTKVMIAARARMQFWVVFLKSNLIHFKGNLGITESEIRDVNCCATGITRKIRNFSWGKEIHGVTYPSLTTQIMIGPLSEFQQRFFNWDFSDCCIHFINRATEAKCQTNDSSLHYAAAPNQLPWVGSKTESKVKFPHLTSNIKTATLSKVQRLLVLKLAISDLGPQIRETIDTAIKSLTTVSMVDLDQFQLSGETGHFTHRLAINSFSMETMPNYRSNILQLGVVNTDNMDILKQDTRDRTINFAAINYYINALVLLPLQFARQLPDNFPTQIAIMLHCRSFQDDQYEMCPECCHVEADRGFTVEFTQPAPLNMLKYATLTLVGCSDYENKVLFNSLSEFLATKIVRQVRDHDLDPYDEVVLEKASIGLLIDLANASVNVAVQAKIENYFQIPSAQLSDLLGAYSGMYNPLNVSVNILRSIPPRLLYMGCLTGLINYFIDKVYVAPTLSVLQAIPHMAYRDAPLKTFFENVLRAGLMGSLIQGSSEVGFLNAPFHVGAGIASSDTCASEFVNQHIPVIQSWILGQHVIPPLRLYTQWQSSEFVRDHFTLIYKKRVVWLCKIVIPAGSSGRDISETGNTLITMIAQYMNDNDYPVEEARFPMRDELIDEVSGIFDHLWTSIYENQPIPNGVHREYLKRWPLLCFFYLTFRKGDWEDLQDEDLEFNPAVDVMSTLGFDLPDPQQFTRAQIEDSYDVYERLMPTWSVDLILMLGKSLIRVLNQFDNIAFGVFMDIIQSMTDYLTNWNQAINTTYICHLNIEEAQRVLRVNNMNQQQLRMSRQLILDELERVRLEHEASFLPVQMVLNDCNMMGIVWHNRRMVHREMHIVGQSPGLSYQSLSHAWSDDDYAPPTRIRVDVREITRAVGRHNTSIAKYSEVVIKMGLLDTHINRDNPRTKLCLADGLGGVTAWLSYMCDHAIVYYNSLRFSLSSGRSPADMSREGYPIELMDPFFSQYQKARVRAVPTATGDLTDPETQNCIINMRQWGQACPDMITMDADIDWSAGLDRYHHLLFGALYIASSILDESTVMVFKTFLINHRTIEKFLLSIYKLFSHVHVVKSACTRAHSLEILVIFSKPTDITQLKLICQRLKDPTTYWTYHQTTVETIREDTLPLSQAYIQFREDGNYSIPWDPLSTYRNFARGKVYPLAVTNIYKWFNLPSSFNRVNSDEWMSQMMEAAMEGLRIWGSVYAMVPINQLTTAELREVRDANPDTVPVSYLFVRRGWQRRRLAILKYLKLVTLRMILGSTACRLGCASQDEMDNAYRLIMISCCRDLKRVGLGTRFRLTFTNAGIMILDFRHHINVTDVIRQSYLKILQYIGIIFYCGSLMDLVQEPHLRDKLWSAAHPGLTISRQESHHLEFLLEDYVRQSTRPLEIRMSYQELEDLVRDNLQQRNSIEELRTMLGEPDIHEDMGDLDDAALNEQINAEEVQDEMRYVIDG